MRSPLIDPVVPVAPNDGSQAAMFQPSLEPEYRIQVGDRLAIRSYYDQQLNQDVMVRRDGRISLILLQDVQVFDRTPAEVARQLSEDYGKFVADAAPITVSVVESKGLTVYVGGEVKTSAQQALNGQLTVVQAITAAGGMLPTANTHQVLVLRHQVDGKFIAYQIDVEKVLVNAANDIYLQRNDIVHVPMSKIAHIDKFVSQYINQIIPEALRFNVGYTWLNQIGDGNSRVQVVGP
ncbi:MAG: polysaccharide biosynthesis/export family protein [Acidobacteria bacterium]|nr:polysaccharide biosynthesis/export family protein [Acidobacteriota bacterium]